MNINLKLGSFLGNKNNVEGLEHSELLMFLNGWNGAHDITLVKFILNFQVNDWKKKMSSIGPVI